MSNCATITVKTLAGAVFIADGLKAYLVTAGTFSTHVGSYWAE